MLLPRPDRIAAAAGQSNVARADDAVDVGVVACNGIGVAGMNVVEDDVAAVGLGHIVVVRDALARAAEDDVLTVWPQEPGPVHWSTPDGDDVFLIIEPRE